MSKGRNGRRWPAPRGSFDLRGPLWRSASTIARTISGSSPSGSMPSTSATGSTCAPRVKTAWTSAAMPCRSSALRDAGKLVDAPLDTRLPLEVFHRHVHVRANDGGPRGDQRRGVLHEDVLSAIDE